MRKLLKKVIGKSKAPILPTHVYKVSANILKDNCFCVTDLTLPTLLARSKYRGYSLSMRYIPLYQRYTTTFLPPQWVDIDRERNNVIRRSYMINQYSE